MIKFSQPNIFTSEREINENVNHYQSKQIGNVHVCECDGRPKLNNIDGNKFGEHMYVCR